MPTPRVIDLSHHNAIPESLIPAKNFGIIGIIHKMTEGSSYDDDTVDNRHYLANQAGMAWGLYHFLRPGDMKQQARFFIDRAKAFGVLDDDTLLAADHEDPEVSYSALLEFLAEVERLANRSPVIYSGHVLKDQCVQYPDQYRLWLAQYSSSPTLPAGCEKYYLWQYSDKGQVPGITPPTDVNHFEGDAIAFLDQWSGMEQPEPGPEPGPEPEDAPRLVVTIDADRPVIVNIQIGENVTISDTIPSD